MMYNLSASTVFNNVACGDMITMQEIRLNSTRWFDCNPELHVLSSSLYCTQRCKKAII